MEKIEVEKRFYLNGKRFFLALEKNGVRFFTNNESNIALITNCDNEIILKIRARIDLADNTPYMTAYN